MIILELRLASFPAIYFVHGTCRAVFQVLSYRFVNVNAVERQGKRLKWEKKPRWLVRVLETMEGALHTRWWRNIVAAIVLLGELLLPYEHCHY